MAFDDIPWPANLKVTSGDEASDGATSFSCKNAEHMKTLLAYIIAALDHIDAN
jgi:hypothetical protein